MKTIKRYWFAAAVTLLVGVIGFNLYTIYYRDGGSVTAERSPEGSDKRTPAAQDGRGGPGIPRTIALTIAPKTTEQKLDAKVITTALQSIGAVQQASFDGGNPATVQLTVVEPVKLSLLSERLENQGAEVIEGRSPLRGDLRLHVSGMT